MFYLPSRSVPLTPFIFIFTFISSSPPSSNAIAFIGTSPHLHSCLSSSSWFSFRFCVFCRYVVVSSCFGVSNNCISILVGQSAVVVC
ncbi:hypothetical protein BC629DRAFT_1497523 [Irpex lacteus]|nr:hypothetical protein BC629DRAFT_1497523 [Irpex lacteus]